MKAPVSDKLLIVTDAWHPQVNGVVRTLSHMIARGPDNGFSVKVLSPQEFGTIPCPTYPEIHLSLASRRGFARRMAQIGPDCVHIATEGPLGWRARQWCSQYNIPFTTSYHTRFPEYVSSRIPVSVAPIYQVLKRFHRSGTRCLVPTRSMTYELERRGFKNVMVWGRGVQTDLFNPDAAAHMPSSLADLLDTNRPKALYVGRLAPEKNLQDFLALPEAFKKVVVGDGPLLEKLKQEFPSAVYLGKRQGRELAAIYAACDVFVFPSKTDTFGIVLLEAIASGLPVAAFPVTGPIDVFHPDIVRNGVRAVEVAALDANLLTAVERALHLDRIACRRFAMEHSWDRSAEQFFGAIRSGNRRLQTLYP